ncbi:ABC transporter permease [Roseomonas sp. BN140053]|uniref:ABC transporter permease n=1 Tax=Roseomonas sp. BN140053 TaxID=3391898 RepID=UPI0039E79DEC
MSGRVDPAAAEALPASRGPGFFRRLCRSRGAALSLLCIATMVLLAVFAPLVAGFDPLEGGADALLPPLSPGHWLGTDDLGRDIWAQVVHGARVSLTVGIVTAIAAVTIGTLVGALAGYYGGWPDIVLMRVSEFFQTLPRFVLALIVIALFGAGLLKVIAVIALLSWPQTARLVRASVASLRQQPFVDAARVGGMGDRALMLREILPNVAAPIIVTGSLDVAGAILLEAGLGFFGLGDPNYVSWGGMLNDAQQYLRVAWWMSLFPGLAIAVTVLSFNVLGDALNDALNPRNRSAA